MFKLILKQVRKKMQKQYKVLKILHPQPGVDVNMTDTNSYTALAWAAAWADKKDIVFLEALANHSKIKLNQQDSEGYTALGRAAEMGRWA